MNTPCLQDGFIYSGNRHESVPRTLFFDKRLTPLERNAWQIIRMSLDGDGITAVPTYEQLRPFLASMPYVDKASFETVARALTILRLTRWLSLAKKRRHKNGTKQSNLYILHDEPLTTFEAIRLDDDYLALVYNAMNHASKAIRQVAVGVLEDIANDPYLSGKKLPTRLEILLGRVTGQIAEEKLSTAQPLQQSEVSQINFLRNEEMLNTESEASRETLQNQLIRNPKSVVSSSNNKNILLQDTVSSLQLPERFYSLRESLQQGILKTIQYLPVVVQQQIFDEWDERCRSKAIRKPTAYLYGIVQKALKGELNDLAEVTSSASHSQTPLLPDAVDIQSVPSNPLNKAQIQVHIQHLKQLLSQNR